MEMKLLASVSCLAPWDIDDNPEDDTKTAFASDLPIVTYESGTFTGQLESLYSCL